jgi:hypothetical protein
MSDPEDTDEEVELSYEPCSVEVADGSAVIGDITGFLSETKSLAVHMREGQMWVLREDSLTWMKIQEVRKSEAKATAKIAAVKSAT